MTAKKKTLDERIGSLWIREMKKNGVVFSEEELKEAVRITKKKLRFLVHKNAL